MVIDAGDGPHLPPPTIPRVDVAASAAGRNPTGASVPTIDYADLDSAPGLQRWLRVLLDEGAIIVEGTPNRDGQVLRLAAYVGYARPTNFGVQFDVESKPDPNSSAYTALGLDLHTDLANYANPPDFQFLHALVNDATGGESTLVDGLAVAQELRHINPDAFETLCTWPVPFRFHDADDDVCFSAPIFDYRGGSVHSMRFNNWIRDIDWSAQGVDGNRFYDAYISLWQLLRSPQFLISFRLAAGQAMCFDNRRMLHGRTAFDPQSGPRHLQGCYVDRDMLASRLRVSMRRAVD